MSHHIDDSKYSVHYQKEIASILEGLMNSRTPVNLATSHGEEFITCVLDINPGRNYVYLDASQDERVNSRVAESAQVSFTTQTGISVKWHSSHVSLVRLDDGDVLSIPIPVVVQRIQRRESFRLSIPQGKNGLVCTISLPGNTLAVPVKDISAGGIGIALKEPHHPDFAQGNILEECSIEFPDVGVVRFKLKICSVRAPGKTRSGENMCHIGMEFTGMSRGASNVVQRYILQMEGEQIHSQSGEPVLALA